MNQLIDKSVLVVDDDPGMLRAMCKLLSRAGMQVKSTSDSTSVLKELTNSGKRFDLLITDLRMPVFSGRGILGFASTALPQLPVIIISAFGGTDARAEALHLGAFAFLEKPIAAAQLIDTATRAVIQFPMRETQPAATSPSFPE